MLAALPIVFIGLCIATFVMGQYGGSQLQTFLDRNKAITDESALNEYKAMVRVNMYLALALIGMTVAVVVIIALVVSRIGINGLFLAGAYATAIGLNGKNGELEKRARSLECSNLDLEKRYQEVTRVWQKQAFPNF